MIDFLFLFLYFNCYCSLAVYFSLIQVDSDDEWNVLLDQTDEFKLSANSGDIEAIMQSAEVHVNLQEALTTSVATVTDGIMEGGSRLRLLVKIIRNCLESETGAGAKEAFLKAINLYVDLPGYIRDISSKKDFSETWFISCLLDLLEVLHIVVKLNVNGNALKHLTKCFDLIQTCLTYSFDKHQKIKTLFLRILLSLVTAFNDYRKNTNNVSEDASDTDLIDCDVINQLLLCGKSLQKVPSLLLLLYEIVIELMRYNENMSKTLIKSIENGSQQWFLDAIIKDINQKRHVDYAVLILCHIRGSEMILKKIAHQCPHLPSLITAIKSDGVRTSMFSLCVQVVGYYQAGLQR